MKLISLRPIENLKDRSRSRVSLVLLFSLWTFLALLMMLAIMSGFIVILIIKGDLSMDSVWDTLTIERLFVYILILSIVIGAVVSLFSGRLIIRPINAIVNVMDHIAAGNFKTRIAFEGALSKQPAVVELSNSINTMADELDHTELLRSGFVNDFSHEFKTPIVSIAGFAKLLKSDDLTEEQRAEYIDIIEKESRRLAALANNVIYLSRIENQTILTDKTTFDLSEQIRECFLLLENKWSNRNIELVLQFDEYNITANEGLLKQIWINMLDNAIKFTPEGGTITVTITDNAAVANIGAIPGGSSGNSVGNLSGNAASIISGTVDGSAQPEFPFLRIDIINTGSSIAPENLSRIFNKFYQEDASRATEGSGIGLAIVKRIVDLHQGSISVTSGNGTTCFSVMLPKRGD